jgi:hypothetical protein
LIKSLEALGERYFPRSYTTDADDSNCEKTAADTGTRYPDTSTQFLNGGPYFGFEWAADFGEDP